MDIFELLGLMSWNNELESIWSCGMDFSEFFDVTRMWWICIGFLIPTALGFVIGLMKEKLKDKKEQEQQAEQEKREEREERKKHDDLVDESMRYLHKDRINQQCEYWLEKGYCPVRSREVITEQTDIYHRLGGNSFITELVSEVMDLPPKKPEKGEQYAR